MSNSCDLWSCKKDAAFPVQYVGCHITYKYCSSSCKEKDKGMLSQKFTEALIERPVTSLNHEVTLTNSESDNTEKNVTEVAKKAQIVNSSSCSNEALTRATASSSEGMPSSFNGSLQDQAFQKKEKELQEVFNVYKNLSAAGLTDFELQIQKFWCAIQPSEDFPVELMEHAIKTKNFEACIMLMNTGVNVQFVGFWKSSYTLKEFAMDLLAYTVINEFENVHGIYCKLNVSIRDRSLLEGILSRVEGKAKQEHVDELKARIHALSREQKRMALSSSSSSSSSSASENPSSNENMPQLLANFLQIYDSFKEAGVLDAELSGLLTPENGPKDYTTMLIAQALREKNERACHIIASLGNTNELLDPDKLKMIGGLLQGYTAPSDLEKLKLIELNLRKEKKEQKQAFSSSSCSQAPSSPNQSSASSSDSSSSTPLKGALTSGEEEYVFVSSKRQPSNLLGPSLLALGGSSSQMTNSSEPIEPSLSRADGTCQEQPGPTISNSTTDDSSSDSDATEI